jgi:hypothetical protein
VLGGAGVLGATITPDTLTRTFGTFGNTFGNVFGATLLTTFTPGSAASTADKTKGGDVDDETAVQMV